MAISREFYLRRLHSLTGVFMGLFLFNHFLTNSFIFWGRDSFNHKVHLIHSLPGLVILEIALIAVPFLFHGIYGVMVMLDSKNNLQHYKYGRNVMYSLQRATAWLLAVFVIWHVWELRFYVNYAVAHYAGEGDAKEFVIGAKFYDYLVMKFESPFFLFAYVLGAGAAIVHWANGLCTFAMSWGVTVGKRSQQGMAVVALGVALLYTAMIGASIYGLIVPPTPPEAIKELNMYPSDPVRISLVPGHAGAQGAQSLF